MRDKRIVVHLIDGTDRSMVVDSITCDSDDVFHFGRDGMEFLAAPRTSIVSWDGVNRASA
jgi:hypothetical protein